MPTLEELQTKVYFNGKPITIGLTQEVLPIRGANGEQGSFIETGIQIDALCGGEPNTTNRVLLWQQGGRTFALFAWLDSNTGHPFVSRLELQRLAETLNGAESGAKPGALDPERLLSLKDAETLAGFDIQQPAMMLTNVRFDHISYVESMGWPKRVATYYSGDLMGAGGTYHLLVFQIPGSQTSLDELRLGGGYTDATVKGYPAIYKAQCSDAELYGTSCFQIISWFEGDTQFDIETYFPALVPEETIIAIAESMR